jgi:predicted permease
VRQLLTESLVLAMLGTALGLGLALVLIRVFRSINPIELGVSGDVGLNLSAIMFSGLLTAAATLLFGLLPAVRTSRNGASPDLKHSGRGAVRGRNRLASAIIAVQIAVSFVLLTGAGLLLSSALKMGSVPLGFEPEHLVSMRITLPAARYQDQDALRMAHILLLQRLEGLAEFSHVALASKVPPEVGGNQTLEVEGQVRPEKEVHNVGGDAVSAAFFDTLSVPLLKGRIFNSQDGSQTQPVAIVNQALAHEYFPNGDVLGRLIRIPGGSMPWLSIIGVVGDLKHTELMNEMQWVETPILYRPLSQEPRRSVSIVARAVGGRWEEVLDRQIADFDAQLPLAKVETVESRIAYAMAYPRFRALVLGLFAISAMLLSAVGLHGVLTQLVSQRTAEFGVRRALGAETRHLISLVAFQGSLPVLAGLAIGVAATQAFSLFFASMLYGVQPTDPSVLAWVSFGLILVSAFATLWPARRATAIDPILALKEE